MLENDKRRLDIQAELQGREKKISEIKDKIAKEKQLQKEKLKKKSNLKLELIRQKEEQFK